MIEAMTETKEQVNSGRGSCPECGSRNVHKEQSVFGGAKTGDLECGDCRASWPPIRDK